MFDLLVRDVMEKEDALALAPDTTVSKAAELMARQQVGAAMVVEQERLIGVFTERDALFRVIARGLDPRTTKLVSPNQVGARSTRTSRPGSSHQSGTAFSKCNSSSSSCSTMCRSMTA